MIRQRISIQFNIKTVTMIIVMIILCIFISSQCNFMKKSSGAATIYAYQATIVDVLDLEIQYMPKYIVEDNDTWTSADDLNGYIFSAYFDARPEVILEESTIESEGQITWAEIRIVSILPLDTDPRQIECVYKFTSNNDDSTVYRYAFASRVKALKENSHSLYSAFFVICELAHPKHYNKELIYNEKQLPESIGIRSRKSVNSIIKFIDVHYPKNGMKQFYEEPEEFMALCAPVLHHQFNRVMELIEFIEYYRLMGINHFTFYISSITEEVKRVFDFYRSEEIVTVLNWHINSLKLRGFIAATNDCLYRNTFYQNYKYVAMFDIDEFMVPSKHKNFSVMLAELDQELFHRECVSFSFTNPHFDSSYPDDSRHDDNDASRYIDMKTKRLRTPHVLHNGSKYILRGHDVLELGNNQRWQLRPGPIHDPIKQFGEMTVEPDVALSRHYAAGEITAETDCYIKSIVIDRTAQKFANKINDKVATICHSVFGEKKCPSPIKRISG